MARCIKRFHHVPTGLKACPNCGSRLIPIWLPFVVVGILLLLVSRLLGSLFEAVASNSYPNYRIISTRVFALDTTARSIIAPTLLLTISPTYTHTPDPGTPTAIAVVPTALEVRISVSEDTNCRVGPGQVFEKVGWLEVGESAIVLGRHPEKDYYVIHNPRGSGLCWLWGEYATITGERSELPIVEPPSTPTPVVLAEEDESIPGSNSGTGDGNNEDQNPPPISESSGGSQGGAQPSSPDSPTSVPWRCPPQPYWGALMEDISGNRWDTTNSIPSLNTIGWNDRSGLRIQVFGPYRVMAYNSPDFVDWPQGPYLDDGLYHDVGNNVSSIYIEIIGSCP